jgi:hypothetical protein
MLILLAPRILYVPALMLNSGIGFVDRKSCMV